MKMDTSGKKHLTKITEEVKNDREILALILFGSTARKDNYKESDVDICLVLMPQSYTTIELSQKKMVYLKSFNLDIHIFQQLPLYIKRRVLKEGKVLHCKDDDALYDLSFTVIREFADFEHIYRDYLIEVENVR
jgi:predicted nucleotidyltransferase